MEIRLPSGIESKLAQLATKQGRDVAGLVVEAAERLVDYDDWFLAAVEKGLTQIQAGKTIAHQEVGERLEKHMATKHQVA